jgi:type I restriction enzyme R subunit
MSLNESIVEDAALEWFAELGYAVGHGPHLAPGEPAAERDSFGDVVQSRVARTLTRPLPRGEEKREAIRRPAAAGPAIPEEASA